MGHSRTSFFLREAAYEARQGLTSLITPIVFLGLTAYMLIFLLNADYMRSMGAVDIYRNSPHVFYLMVSGQSLWLFFAWAWLFAQIVVRDRSAELHEVVLVSPISLKWLIAARFSGALLVAILLGSSICVGLLLAPVLVTFGALPPDTIGPVPWSAAAWSIIVFTVPSAFATGVLFVIGASKTRSNAGAFAVAALLSLVWMLSLIVLHEGGVSPFLASLIDPSAYVEAERQALLWTPAEKKVAMIGFTDLLLLNRGLWLLVGLVLGTVFLLRLRREHLAMERAPSSKAAKVSPVNKCAAAPVGPIVDTRWWQSLVTESMWHLKVSLQSFGIRLALVLLTVVGVAAAWVNSVGHMDGPLVPTPESLLYFMVAFFFVFIVFVVVGFTGALMRRDDHDGFNEWLDTSPVPLGVRLLARFIAALGLTALLCLVPAVASLMMTGMAAPHSLNLTFPFTYVLLTVFPAMVELCAIAVLAHALFKSAGTAYVVSILVAFIAIVNHEVELVQYTPAAIGTPIHAYPSELTGWAPWLPIVSALAGLKLAVALCIFAASWLAWRRGTALTLGDRMQAVRKRLVGSAGLTALASIVALVLFVNVLNIKLIDDGGYLSSAEALEHDAQWEQQWWSKASTFSLHGGEVSIVINPSKETGKVHWRIDQLQANQLHGTLPHGVVLEEVQRDNVNVEFEVDSEHFVVESACDTPCTLTLTMALTTQGWQHEKAPWIYDSGVWLRAQDVLPVLGHDPNRLVRSVGDRARLGLSADLPTLPEAAALRAVNGVAPVGQWSWSLIIDQGDDDLTYVDQGNIKGTLSFATHWRSKTLSVHHRGSTAFLIGEARLPLLDGFANDLASLHQCTATHLGGVPMITSVIQAPRKSGDIAVYNQTLWAPEDVAWQSDGTGVGAWQRQYKVALAIANDKVSTHKDLRMEAGSRWLVEGIAGWTALLCVEELSGFDAAITVRKRAAEKLAEVFATIDKPVTTVADADPSWLGLYAALSLDNWGVSLDKSPRDLLAVLDSDIQSKSLLVQLAEYLDEKTVNVLLGAPLSSDVSISTDNTGMKTTTTAWIWQSGGWQVRETQDKLHARSSDGVIRDASPSDLSEQTGNVYLFYPGYGYERSLDDNRFYKHCIDNDASKKPCQMNDDKGN